MYHRATGLSKTVITHEVMLADSAIKDKRQTRLALFHVLSSRSGG